VIGKVEHGTFTIEREYSATPEQVFAAWSDPAAKARWFKGPGDWVKTPHSLDFRVGGEERVAGGPKDGPCHAYRARYEDIVPNRRIIYSYDMHLDDKRISVSLATVEFFASAKGTKLIFTEQDAFLAGSDGIVWRKEGTQLLLDNLGAELGERGSA